MKHVLFALTIVLVVFAVGCQDNSMTGPGSSSATPMVKPAPQTGSLLVKGDVYAGQNGTADRRNLFHVLGTTSYEYRIVGEGETAMYQFTIHTSATVRPDVNIFATGSVSDQSIYEIAAANKESVVYTQRDYYVPELGTKFHIIFAIELDNSLSVQSMWLDQVGLAQGHVSAN